MRARCSGPTSDRGGCCSLAHMGFISRFFSRPLVNIAAYSVFTYSPTTIIVTDLTAANYLRLWDTYYVQLFLRTIKLAFITTGLCALLGYPVAYVLARAAPSMMSLGLFLLVVPLMVSTVIRVFGWTVILGRNGVVNDILALLGFDPLRMMYTETAVVIGLCECVYPVYGAAADGRDRAYSTKPRRGRRQSRRKLVPGVRARHLPHELSWIGVRRIACVQCFTQRFRDPGAHGRRACARGGIANFRRGAGLVQLAGCVEPRARVIAATLMLIFFALRATRQLARLEKQA